MKLKKIICWPPLLAGVGAGFTITILAYITFQSIIAGHIYGLWLTAAFGSSVVLVFGFPENEFAQTKNVIFGHLICGFVGILFLPKYLPEFSELLSSINLSFSILALLILLINSLLVFLFLNTHVLSKVLSKIKFLSRFEKYTTVFSFYTTYLCLWNLLHTKSLLHHKIVEESVQL